MVSFDPKDPTVIAEFERLCLLEPRLRALYDQASQLQDDGSHPTFCSRSIWYGKGERAGFRSRLGQLVGCGAGRISTASSNRPPIVIGKTFGIDPMFGYSSAPRSERPAILEDFPEELRTSRAYDLAHDVIYARLPACRNCRCRL